MSLEISMPSDNRARMPQREYAKAFARDMEGRRSLPVGMTFNAAIITDMFDDSFIRTIFFAILGFVPVALLAIYLRSKK